MSNNDWIKNRDRTLGKIAEAVVSCRNVFDWEKCEPSCIMYQLCNLSGINKAIQDTEYIMKCLKMVKEQIRNIRPSTPKVKNNG